MRSMHCSRSKFLWFFWTVVNTWKYLNKTVLNLTAELTVPKECTGLHMKRGESNYTCKVISLRVDYEKQKRLHLELTETMIPMVWVGSITLIPTADHSGTGSGANEGPWNTFYWKFWEETKLIILTLLPPGKLETPGWPTELCASTARSSRLTASRASEVRGKDALSPFRAPWTVF